MFFRKKEKLTSELKFDDYVEKNHRKALLLAKHIENTGALSFLGGHPIMPKGYSWPQGSYGEQSMSFLAQINIADLAIKDQNLPDKGILYFFIDEAALEGEESNPAVLYSEETQNLEEKLPEVDPPIIGHDLIGGGYTYYLDKSHKHFPICMFPKYEIKTEVVRDVPFPPWRLDDKGFDQYRNWQKAETETALANLYGQNALAKRGSKNWKDEACDRILDPNSEVNSFLNKDETGVSELFIRWPQTWVHICLHLGSFLDDTNYQLQTMEDLSLKKEFMDDCQHWIDRAKEQGMFTEVTEDVRWEYRSWLSTLFLSSYKKWIQRTSSHASYHRICDLLRKNMKGSALDATSLCLDLNQPNRELITHAEKDAYLGWLEPRYRHQMFGYGEDIQGAAKANEDKILLLQLVTDYSMLWMLADCGVVQYWISKDDLVNQRFDRVEVTVEGG